MDAVLDALVLVRRPDVLEPARDEQAAMEAAQPVRLVEVGRPDDAGRALPAELLTGDPGGAEVHAPVEQDERRQPAADAHVHGPHAVLVAVGQADRARGDELGEVADMAPQLRMGAPVGGPAARSSVTPPPRSSPTPPGP